MAVSEENRFRFRMVLVSREAKAVFRMVPERFLRAIAGRWLLGRLLRWMFLAADGQPHRAGEVVLAELRNRYALGSVFSNDPLIMARRAGRREVFDDLVNWLNLDEARVQRLMEVDDGLGN